MLGSNDFKVGATIFKGDGALRYMYDPPIDGRSIGHANDYPMVWMFITAAVYLIKHSIFWQHIWVGC